VTAVAVACIDAPAAAGIAGRTPCGACRQWLIELAPDAELAIQGVGETMRVRDLLPHAFVLKGQGR
ncbi:MAG: hypothetical protein ACREFC_07310, partial [Stellaceae bacterium]